MRGLYWCITCPMLSMRFKYQPVNSYRIRKGTPEVLIAAARWAWERTKVYRTQVRKSVANANPVFIWLLLSKETSQEMTEMTASFDTYTYIGKMKINWVNKGKKTGLSHFKGRNSYMSQQNATKLAWMISQDKYQYDNIHFGFIC